MLLAVICVNAVLFVQLILSSNGCVFIVKSFNAEFDTDMLKVKVFE